jgi:hypothetical protein
MSDNKEIVNNNGLINKDADSEKSIKQLLTQEFIKSPDKTEGFNNIFEIFEIFSGIYGDNWNRQYENETARDTWAVILWEIDKKTLIKATKDAMEKHQRFPPNLAEFKSLCDSNKKASNIENTYKRLPTGQNKK